LIREKSVENLENLGIKIDPEKNLHPEASGGEIGHAESRIKIFVIPTNEELAIAQQTFKLI